MTATADAPDGPGGPTAAGERTGTPGPSGVQAGYAAVQEGAGHGAVKPALGAGGSVSAAAGTAQDPGPDAASPPRAAARAESVLGRGYFALTLGIVSVVFLVAFEATAVGTAMPVAADELDGVSVYAFAFSALFTTSLLGMVVSGQ